MFSAKTMGGGMYVVFDSQLGAQASERLQMESDLYRALARQEFYLNYQPIFSSETWQLVGFEALMRWNHPEQDIVSPTKFIPILEETGEIIAVGRWCLEVACQQLVRWQEQYPAARGLSMSVNLSGKHMSQPNLVEQVAEILQRTGCNPRYLKLEITESVLMDNFEAVRCTLETLKAMGIQIYIDDFGTGYSSFRYLDVLPIDAIKIDRSFISGSDRNDNSWPIVDTIVSLAKRLGIDAIAEGVETAEQMARLQGMDCDMQQGYFMSKPLNARAAESLIARTHHPLVTPPACRLA